MRQHVFAVACLSTCLVMSTLAKAAEKVVAPLGIAQDKNGDQKKATPIAPAEALAEGWEEIDERLIFLMVRLANTESSLEAVEKVIAANSRKRTAKTSEAKRAIGENEKMDRKGGGPMKWSQFYGTTAEKFFYHPTDRNSTYHTETILSPQPPQNDNQTGPGIPSRQGLPVHQRPPQFDYIYKANETVMARADAEAAQLKNKVEALTERRQKLEQEQVALWIEIAFRVAAHFDIDKKPMFRFEPQIAGDDAESQLHADMLKSAASFMRVALAIVEEANTDQEATLLRIKPAVKEARQTLNDSWLRLAVDTADKTTTEGKFAALAKRLDDVSSNLTESYEFANEGDQEQDVIRKETFRGLLQESLIRYAQIILAMDEMATEMKDEWNIKPDLNKPFGTVSLANIEITRSAPKPKPEETKPTPKDSKENAKPAEDDSDAEVLLEETLDKWIPVKKGEDISNWSVSEGVLTLDAIGPSIRTKKTYDDFDLHLEFKLPPKCNTGVFLRGRYELQLLDSQFTPASGKPLPATGKCGAIWGLIAPSKDVYKGPKKWNTLDVRFVGDKVTVKMNDVVIIENKVIKSVTGGALDENESDPGPILLQAHATAGQEFRNITIKPIPIAE